MKLIRILALVAASAVLAPAQTTSGNAQATGSSAQGTSTTSQTKTDQKKQTNGKSSPAVKNTPKSAETGPVKLVEKKNAPASTSGAQTGSTKKGATGTSTAATSTKPSNTTGSKPVVQAAPASKTAAQGSTTTKGTSKKAGSATATATKVPQGKPAVTEKKSPFKSNATKAVAKPKQTQPKVVEKKGTGKPAGKPASTVVNSLARRNGRRDPFLSPIKPVGPVVAQRPGCATGKRCLYIPELVLKGTAKDTEGKMVAVVSNPTQRTYFLRENDQVFNGNVEKITTDSVIFREFTTDTMGRESAHEVVKRINPSTQGPG